MNSSPTQGAENSAATAPQGVESLAPDLVCFESRPSGSLADVQKLRWEIAAFVQSRPKSTPSGMLITDHSVPGRRGDPDVGIRIYRSSDASPAPALLHCHGGAFVLGSPALDDPLCIHYARGAECTVVSVDYRLAPEHPCPAAIEDCYAVLQWIAARGEAHGIDATCLAVSGSSAGGALAASVAQLARDRKGPDLAFQMLVYPVLDDRLITDSVNTFTSTPVFARPAAVEMWALYLKTAKETQYAAPARAESVAGLPAAYIEAAELDPLRDEAIEYGERLRSAGVRVDMHLVAGAPHGFDQDYLGAPANSATAKRMLDLRTGALRSAFRPP